MKYILLSLAVFVLCVAPQVAFAGCSTQTITIDGKMIVCTVCYDMQGNPIMTTCM